MKKRAILIPLFLALCVGLLLGGMRAEEGSVGVTPNGVAAQDKMSAGPVRDRHAGRCFPSMAFGYLFQRYGPGFMAR